MPLKHNVEEIILHNGARGLLIDVPDATVVAYTIHFRAGNDYVSSPSVQQTAHIMEHMVFGPNKKFATAELFSQEFTQNGAYSNATTWDRGMSYIADCAYMEWNRILDLQELAITQPKFLQKSLDAEKGNVREELVGQANNHSRVMWQHIYRAMGDDSFLDTEKVETISAVSLSDIVSHHKKTHTLHNMRFSITGDFAKHKAKIIRELGDWSLPHGERLSIKKTTLHSAPPVYLYRKDLANVIFGIAMVLNRELSTEEMVAMSALNHILTGTFHSRIWGKARSRGICYGMGSSASTDISGTTSWELYGQVGVDNAEPLFRLIASQLQKVAHGDIGELELHEAQQYALGSWQMKGQTVNSLSTWYSGEYFDYDTIDPMGDSPHLIKTTTTGTITKLAKEFLEAGHWTIGAIGSLSEEQLTGHYRQLEKIFTQKGE